MNRDELRFTVPVPPSLKNGVVLGRKNGRPCMRTAPRVLVAMRQIRDAAVEAARDLGVVLGHDRESWLGDDEVAVEITHHVRAKTIEVAVTRLGPKPKPPTGRGRDLQNLQDTVCDALQRYAYDDDRQVGRLTMHRSTLT